MQQSVRTNLEEGNEIYFQELNNYIRSYYVSSACPMPGAVKASLVSLPRLPDGSSPVPGWGRDGLEAQGL